ncbi:MAG: hypothetical protein QOK44_1175 [Betaproteobacteria bacterium]|nr:hypothetical protein [Betaproteobacteria bacterium]
MIATYRQRSVSVAILLQVSVALRVSARRVRRIAVALQTWITRRRAARAALTALHAMSERELHDIGLARAGRHRACRVVQCRRCA